jgi:N-methylhydantoinase B
VVSYSAGGGGYGPPWQREVARAVHDLEEGWISAARAATVYGLVLGPEGTVDEAATTARRGALAGGRAG